MKKLNLSGKKLLIIYFVVLTAVLLFTGIMGMLGYSPIKAGGIYLLLSILIISALALATYAVVKKLNGKWKKRIAGIVGGLITALIAIGLLVFFLFMESFYTPKEFCSFRSPDGCKAVLMYVYSQEHLEERAQKRREADPDAPEDELVFDDLDYTYVAYPKALGLFYNIKKGSETRLCIGCNSQAQIMYEWLDGKTLHLYIDQPEKFDEGEITLKF